MDGEELEKFSVQRDLGIPGVPVDSVEEVVLFVVVGCEDDEVDDTLEDLETLLITARGIRVGVREPTARSFSGSSSTASVSNTCL